MNYDPETNIAYIELASFPIINTIELGDFIIHLSATNTPVLIEILNASKFKTKLSKINTIPKLETILPRKVFPTTKNL